MAKWLLVFKHELATTVLRRSFILTIFLFPLISYAIIMLISLLMPFQESNAVSRVMVDAGISIQDESDDLPMGYVDPGGLIRAIPPWVDSEKLVRYENEEDARMDVWIGYLSAVYVIDPQYVQTGKIELYRQGSYMAASEGPTALETMLNYNLLREDASLTLRVDEPLDVSPTYLSKDVQADPNNILSFVLPYIITIVFFTVLMGAASLILNSIISEKQNRVMEILVTSVSPAQLITGKLAAQGIAGLLHNLVWLVGGYLLFGVSDQQFNLPAGIQLSPSIIVWGVIFFLLGYAIYGTIMAGLGALVPGIREASQVTTILLTPMLIPLFFISFFVRNPNGALAITLSLFPLTAPVAVMMRLASGVVPLWHVFLSAIILSLTAWLLVRMVSGLFRARYLLSGQTFNFKLLLNTLRELR